MNEVEIDFEICWCFVMGLRAKHCEWDIWQWPKLENNEMRITGDVCQAVNWSIILHCTAGEDLSTGLVSLRLTRERALMGDTRDDRLVRWEPICLMRTISGVERKVWPSDYQCLCQTRCRRDQRAPVPVRREENTEVWREPGVRTLISVTVTEL